jgi:hypothetical protein
MHTQPLNTKTSTTALSGSCAVVVPVNAFGNVTSRKHPFRLIEISATGVPSARFPRTAIISLPQITTNSTYLLTRQ